MNSITQEYKTILETFFQAEKVGDYSLDNTEMACRYFGNPEKSYKTIHIAGTNGKGSVSKMVFQILKDSGKKVGVYTSPHLVSIQERFETEIGKISEEDFIRYARMVIDYGGNLSYFERCAVLAFLYFRDQGVEYGVFEVGLGGRLDATNVIFPIVTAITGISYDHMEFLGNTLEQIAKEKGGIIKPGIPVVLYEKNPVLEEIARENSSQVIIPRTSHIVTNLLGSHQERNARIAYEIGALLGVDDSSIRKSLLHVRHPGRMQYLYPNLLIDGAHNEEGMRALKTYLGNLSASKEVEIVYCFNLKAGKNASLVDEIFPEVQEWNIVQGVNPLLADGSSLQSELRALGKESNIITPSELLHQRDINKEKLYVVFGSLYLLGELVN